MARSLFFYTDSRLLGGAEQAMLMLAESLDRSRWEPTLVLERGAGVEALVGEAGRLSMPVLEVAPMPLGLDGARRVPAFAAMLRRHRPAVFHAHMSSPLAAKFALAAAVLARVPGVVGTVQVIGDLDLDRSNRLQLRLLAARVDRHIAVSDAIAEELASRFGWPEGMIEVIHNAVEVERFRGASAATIEGLAGERPVVLTCARLDEQKGHPILLEAAASVADAEFVLAGEGPERRALETMAARLRLGDRVHFLGERRDIPELLAASDIFALPSLYEGTSLAVLEAMAAGKAIVSSRIGGTDELIDDERSGLLVPSGDPEALAAALRRLLGDAGLRARLGAGALVAAEAGFTRGTMAQRVCDLYEEILG